MINSFKNPAIMRILRTTERYEAGWREQNFIPDNEAARLKERCSATVTGDATSGLTPLLHQFTLNSTWLLRSAPSKTGCFL